MRCFLEERFRAVHAWTTDSIDGSSNDDELLVISSDGNDQLLATPQVQMHNLNPA